MNLLAHLRRSNGREPACRENKHWFLSTDAARADFVAVVVGAVL